MVGNHNGKGIPSKTALHFPEKGGRKFGAKIWDNNFRWNLEDLTGFLFPQEYSPVCHRIASEYLEFLIERGEVGHQDKQEFCSKHGHSLNTLTKNVIPKLYRFGLIHRTRQLPRNTAWNIKSRRKSREHESLQFSTFLRKIADEWESIVATGRIRRNHDNQKQKEKQKEIEKQEKLEWERYLRENAR